MSSVFLFWLWSSLDLHFIANIVTLDMIKSLNHILSLLKVDTVACLLVVLDECESL